MLAVVVVVELAVVDAVVDIVVSKVVVDESDTYIGLQDPPQQ